MREAVLSVSEFVIIVSSLAINTYSSSLHHTWSNLFLLQFDETTIVSDLFQIVVHNCKGMFPGEPHPPFFATTSLPCVLLSSSP